ncbi:alpha-galactosidase [Runella limosa]|uniref:alpha-galactosidase n=1 Tax=Runella limosa TaxID=370978 RepID=UPI0003F6D63F|nr:alpha-galactosidase [Runella limosa]
MKNLSKLSRKILRLYVIFAALTAHAQTQPRYNQPATVDWLVTPVTQKAEVITEGKNIILYNGLVKRVFRIEPNVACIDYKNLSNGQQLLRAVKPEAKIVVNGKMYNIGGLMGQKENAYLLPEWVDKFTVGKDDFVAAGHSVSEIKPFVNWKANSWAATQKGPSGKVLTFRYKAQAEAVKGLEVTVNYELYDGIPLIVKWVSVENKQTGGLKLNRVVNEVLALVEEESAVVGKPTEMKKQHGMYVETNYAFNNAMRYDISDQTTHWKIDSTYTSQVNYNFETPCLLEVYPEKAPGIDLQPNEVFKSVRTHELLMDSYDRQRRGMMIRKMYRTVAPWTTQNPIFMHLVSKNDQEVRSCIDQCAATGYEAVILSFGSHLNMEDSTAKNIARWKELADYAHSKNILLGGYSLFSSRRISDEDDVVDPKTGKPGGAFFGHAPCFGSKWGLAYRNKIKHFFAKTGFDIWENDGPYPGDVCGSTVHPGHKGLDDSQWRQMEIQKELYRWLNERGVYINAPDWYFLDGTHKIAIGYREVNFSLSREQQRILNRQNIHDGTMEKTASMSWGFVPLTRYQGGGPEAVLEPLSEHLTDYEQLMVQYYGAGVQACYRGPRLYDTETTRQLVSKTVAWYKQYRDILNADMIHLRRADGRDWDGFIHVDPQQKQKGFLMLYNPTKERITRTINVPLYYTGLTSSATFKEKGATAKKYTLNRNYEVSLTVTIDPESYTWFTVE